MKTLRSRESQDESSYQDAFSSNYAARTAIFRGMLILLSKGLHYVVRYYGFSLTEVGFSTQSMPVTSSSGSRPNHLNLGPPEDADR